MGLLGLWVARLVTRDEMAHALEANAADTWLTVDFTGSEEWT